MEAQAREGSKEEGGKRCQCCREHSSWMTTPQHHGIDNHADCGEHGRCSLRSNCGSKVNAVGCQMNDGEKVEIMKFDCEGSEKDMAVPSGEHL